MAPTHSPTVGVARPATAETGYDTGPLTVGFLRPRPASPFVTDGQGSAVTGASPDNRNAAALVRSEPAA